MLCEKCGKIQKKVDLKTILSDMKNLNSKVDKAIKQLKVEYKTNPKVGTVMSELRDFKYKLGVTYNKINDVSAFL